MQCFEEPGQGLGPGVDAGVGIAGLVRAVDVWRDQRFAAQVERGDVGDGFARRTVVLLIPPIPMPAWVFVTVYGVIELYLGITGSASGVAHFAHLGGMVGGYLMILYWRSGTHRRRF